MKRKKPNAIRFRDGSIADYETGEIKKELGVFTSLEELERNKNYKKREKLTKEKREANNLTYEKIDEKFIWSYFREQEKLFPDLKPQDITKLIYIATYCEYKTNILMINKTYMSKNDMFRILNVSRSVFFEWFNKMVELKYFGIKNDRIKLNNNFFNRGNLLDNGNATRIFIDIFRNLYENIEAKDHHKVGYILQLIPYMNPRFNALVSNPRETDASLLKRLTISDLANILGFSDRQYRNLAKDLLSITFGERKEPIIALVALRSLDVGGMKIVLNSNLVFGGNFNEFKNACDNFGGRLLAFQDFNFVREEE